MSVTSNMQSGQRTKDTPILFTPENVRAILDGRNTQTRRIVKLTDSGRIKKPGSPKNWHPDDQNAIEACPYGQPGDRLWVRETWTARTDVEPRTDKAKQYVRYKADNSDLSMEWHRYHHWSPSIHMPKMYCRLVLEMTEVRVERLQEISQADAIAEGAPPSHPSIDVVSREFGYPDFSRSWYAQLWESINGEGSWARNPWVWVLTFKRVTNG